MKKATIPIASNNNDKHKLWLIVGITVAVILIAALVFVSPFKKTIAGRATQACMDDPNSCPNQLDCTTAMHFWVPVLSGGPSSGCYAACPMDVIDFTNDHVCKLAQGLGCTADAPDYCESGICDGEQCTGACTAVDLPSVCNSQSTCTAAGFLWSLLNNPLCISGPTCPSGTEDTNNDRVCGRVVGGSCISNVDCESNNCVNTICAAPPTCDAAHPSACTDQLSCNNFGFKWLPFDYSPDDGVVTGCYAACPLETVDSDNNLLCGIATGFFGCSANNMCDSNNCDVASHTCIPGCDASHLALCTTQTLCTPVGYWGVAMVSCGNACPASTQDTSGDHICRGINGAACDANDQCLSNICSNYLCAAAPTCDAAHPSLCATQASCIGIGNKWLPFDLTVDFAPAPASIGCYRLCPSGVVDSNNDGACRFADGGSCEESNTCESNNCNPATFLCAVAAVVDADADGVPDADEPPACRGVGTPATVNANGCLYGDGDVNGCVTSLEYTVFKAQYKTNFGSIQVRLASLPYTTYKARYKTGLIPTCG